MKTIIAGSRWLGDTDIQRGFVMQAIAIAHTQSPITEVVSGGCRGVDRLGERWARERGIPVTVFPADWEGYGHAAGPRRNVEMAEYANALIAIWDGKSRGTQNMVDVAREKGLQVFRCRIDETGLTMFLGEQPHTVLSRPKVQYYLANDT